MLQSGLALDYELARSDEIFVAPFRGPDFQWWTLMVELSTLPKFLLQAHQSLSNSDFEGGENGTHVLS